MQMDHEAAEAAVQRVADAMGLPLKRAAAGIIDIVNENMFGALRLVSVEQGHDPRDFSLIAFGGAGPMHANALGRLTNAWPVIIPPGPGVLCAYGDATTRLRDEASRTYIKRFEDTRTAEVTLILEELADTAAKTLDAEDVPRIDQTAAFEIDVRYHGQGLTLTVNVDLDEFRERGLEGVAEKFDQVHEQLFTFNLDVAKELVNLRAIIQGKATIVDAETIPIGDDDPSAARIGEQEIFADGTDHMASIYDRGKLLAGNLVSGPAIVTEMDSTTLILPGHIGEVDTLGNILIRPAQLD
jgi:N-methylhydantoinase A